MKAFWDERYSQEDYVYGKSPNVFFAREIQKVSPGKLLMPAEGEGRNAVFAAAKGWDVHAFDISLEGKRKAEGLAQQHQVQINYEVCSLETVQYETESFDVIGLIFAHFPSLVKATYFAKLIQFLKPGGLVLLEGFSKNHLKFSSENPKAGGPRDPDLLYTMEEMGYLFSPFEVLLLEEAEIFLAEGEHHVGKSSVVRFIGRK